jgi:sarcosine oxidase, subunit alpha
VSAGDPQQLRLAPPQNPVEFTFEGNTLTGQEGEPIAVALHANGVTTLSRSFKYNRPRGLHCLTDTCPNCALRVNGLPGVSSCVTPLHAGDTIDREHAWPNADHSVLGLIDRSGDLFPAGFQYRRLRKAGFASAAWEWALARIAGHGRLSDAAASSPIVDRARWRERAVDVVVVGAGPAGIAAAHAAAASGAEVLLTERQTQLGGYLLDTDRGADAAVESVSDPLRLAADLQARENVTLLCGTTATGWYDEQLLALNSPQGTITVKPRSVILATGTYEQRLAFPDADRPGVFTAYGAQRLINRHGVLPGRRVAVIASEDYGYELAGTVTAAGAEVEMLIDIRHGPQHAHAPAGVTAMTGARPLRVLGANHVSGLRYALLDGRERELQCDALIIAAGRRPALELLQQRAGTPGLVASGAVPPAPADGWWVVGGAAGTTTLHEAEDSGHEAGEAAAASLS